MKFSTSTIVQLCLITLAAAIPTPAATAGRRYFGLLVASSGPNFQKFLAADARAGGGLVTAGYTPDAQSGYFYLEDGLLFPNSSTSTAAAQHATYMPFASGASAISLDQTRKALPCAVDAGGNFACANGDGFNTLRVCSTNYVFLTLNSSASGIGGSGVCASSPSVRLVAKFVN